MRTILILLLSIFLLTGCYREIREEIKLIDESVPVSVVEYGANGSDCEDDSRQH